MRARLSVLRESRDWVRCGAREVAVKVVRYRLACGHEIDQHLTPMARAALGGASWCSCCAAIANQAAANEPCASLQHVG